MSGYLLGLTIALIQAVSLAFADTPLMSETWLLHQEAAPFAASFVRPCLSSAGADVITGGSRITVKENSECLANIKRFSEFWDKNLSLHFSAFHLDSTSFRAEKETILKQRFESSVQALPYMGSCACMVLTGPNADYAAAMLSDPLNESRSLGIHRRRR